MNQVRRVLSTLGLRDGMLVAGFLTANLLIETISNLLSDIWWLEVLWVLVFASLTLSFALRISKRLEANERADFDNANSTDVYGARGDMALARRRGAVILVGLDSGDTSSALAKLIQNADKLEWLALIGTHETHNLRVTETIRKRTCSQTRHSFDDEHVRIWEHNHALSVHDYASSVQEAIAWMARHGLHESEIIVDVTAGRRMAGFGAIQAADAAKVEAQYLAYRWDHQLHRPDTSAESFRIVSSYWPLEPAPTLNTSSA